MTEKGYDGVIGHEDVIAGLKEAVLSGKVAHAYIFNGEAGSGKKYIAKRFAMALLCEEKSGEPCMECKSCKMTLSGNHPDIIFVKHEKTASVGVDEIRKQVVEDIEIRPYCSDKKIYVIPEASKMTPQAQNALLKTLEEPPEYAYIFLLADNPDILLPTILSRCVMINLRPLPDEVIEQYLMTNMAVPSYDAKLQARFALGNLGRAKRIASAGDFDDKLRESLRFLRNSKDMDTISRMEFDKKIAADKQGVCDYLDIFTLWFRDVLYFKASNDLDGIIFQNEQKSIKERAAVSSYEGIMKILEAIDAAKARLKANVNPELVLELLFLTIWEE
ncbi:MAG: DNA polymerase III subunit delta' [Lachnospiraceae bacterium]|nr:DNA polymerase III subunit delta' [Lachnospiraceae bacterium]